LLVAKSNAIVARVWQGRVLDARAEEYSHYHYENGVKPLLEVEGNIGVQVLRRSEQGQTEFTTISYWTSREAIRKFVGGDIEQSHHLPRDAEYLVELPQRVRHYEVEHNFIGNTERSTP
jgi:heme-degrading monooxygenase HmoA